MAQPFPDNSRKWEPDLSVIALLALSLVLGTAYLFAEIGEDATEGGADALRAGLVLTLALGFFRAGFVALARRIDAQEERAEEAYSLGYVDGLARRPPAVSEDRRILRSIN